MKRKAPLGHTYLTNSHYLLANIVSTFAGVLNSWVGWPKAHWLFFATMSLAAPTKHVPLAIQPKLGRVRCHLQNCSMVQGASHRVVKHHERAALEVTLQPLGLPVFRDSGHQGVDGLGDGKPTAGLGATVEPRRPQAASRKLHVAPLSPVSSPPRSLEAWR